MLDLPNNRLPKILNTRFNKNSKFLVFQLFWLTNSKNPEYTFLPNIFIWDLPRILNTNFVFCLLNTRSLKVSLKWVIEFIFNHAATYRTLILPYVGDDELLAKLGAGKMIFHHRRRIYTEEKAKVVAATWGTELLQFLAALAIFSPGQS